VSTQAAQDPRGLLAVVFLQPIKLAPAREGPLGLAHPLERALLDEGMGRLGDERAAVLRIGRRAGRGHPAA